jgi:hypothetical protein
VQSRASGVFIAYSLYHTLKDAHKTGEAFPCAKGRSLSLSRIVSLQTAYRLSDPEEIC